MFQLTLNLVYSLIFLQETIGPDKNGQKDMCIFGVDMPSFNSRLRRTKNYHNGHIFAFFMIILSNFLYTLYTRSSNYLYEKALKL
jgi:hypothetical protein